MHVMILFVKILPVFVFLMSISFDCDTPLTGAFGLKTCRSSLSLADPEKHILLLLNKHLILFQFGKTNMLTLYMYVCLSKE